MKRFFVFALTLALVASFALSAGAAERKGMIGVDVGVGVLLPMGDFGDLAKMGWRASGGGGVNFAISPTAAIFVEGAFHNIFSEGSATNYITGTAGVSFMFGGGGGTQ